MKISSSSSTSISENYIIEEISESESDQVSYIPSTSSESESDDIQQTMTLDLD